MGICVNICGELGAKRPHVNILFRGGAYPHPVPMPILTLAVGYLGAALGQDACCWRWDAHTKRTIVRAVGGYRTKKGPPCGGPVGEAPAALAAETVAAFVEPFECIVGDATPD